MSSFKRFEGKKALVTGGSRGIGKAIVERLAQEGAKVVFSYNASKGPAEQLAASLSSAGHEVIAVQADANHVEAFSSLVQKTVDQFGGLDILINNAGIFEGGTLLDADLAQFEKTIDVNVLSPVSLIKAASTHLPQGGRIINISSCLGERAAFAGGTSYITSKFAVSGLTRALSWDLAEKGITVNAVLPGPIETDMGNPDLAGLTALKRLGQPSEVAAAVAFLASDEAAYITGAQLEIDGGWNA